MVERSILMKFGVVKLVWELFVFGVVIRGPGIVRTRVVLEIFLIR